MYTYVNHIAAFGAEKMDATPTGKDRVLRHKACEQTSKDNSQVLNNSHP